MRQDHHGGSVEYKNTWLFDPPDIGSVPENVHTRPIFVKNKDFAFRVYFSDNPNGGQNGGQTHS